MLGHEEVVVEDNERMSKPVSNVSGQKGAGRMNPDERARASIDIARKGKHAAARKHGEFQPGADVESDGRPSSLEQQMEKSQEVLQEDFPLSDGLTTAEAEAIFAKVGPNMLPEKKTPKWLIFLNLLRGPLPYMLWLAALIEIGIQEWIDAGILFGILFGNAALGYHETTKAGDAVDALKKSLKPSACVYRDGAWIKDFDATKLVPGDLVELGLGSTVPADCMLNEGTVDVDESAMTGESFPVTLKEREMAKMGGIVARGETHATVVLTGPNTFFGKTAQMLNAGSGGYSNMQLLLMRIVSVLVVMTLLLCFACFGYLLGIGVNITDSLNFFVAVVVSSIPLAIEIVATVTLALGSRQMSAYGAIVNRLAAIEDLAGMNMLCSDKTGTLTKNKMVIQDGAPAFMEGLNQMELLKFAAMAAQWERPPKDALDTLVLRCHLWNPSYAEEKEKYRLEHPEASQQQMDDYLGEQINACLQDAMKGYERLHYMPFDARVKRTESTVKKPDGQIIKITKGAPHIVGALDANEKIRADCEEIVTDYGEDGVRAMAIAISEPLDHFVEDEPEEQRAPIVWHMAGLLTFCDPPRDDTKETIRKATHYGVPVRMITGDHLLIAKKTCRDLDMGDKGNPNWPNIQGPEGLPCLNEKGEPPKDLKETYGRAIESADGYAQVFPEHKFLIVETYRRLGYKCGMTGDGVNDAPALKKADVGIAVAGATDAATVAADIILTREGLSTIIDGLVTARIVFQRVKSFLTYRIAASCFLLVFSFTACFALIPDQYRIPEPLGPIIMGEQEYTYWRNFFQVPVLYLMFASILNDATLIAIGYDTVNPSRYPEAWNLPLLFFVAAFLASFTCSASLVFLWMMLDSWSTTGAFSTLGIGPVSYGTISCAMYLELAVSAVLTLYASRTPEQFFFQAAPHPVLFCSTMMAIVISLMISLFWAAGDLSGFHVEGLAWNSPHLFTLYILLWCITIFLVQDVAKVVMYKFARRVNLLGINDTIAGKGDSAENEDS